MFDIISNPQIDSGVLSFNEEGKYPYFTRSVLNNGFLGNIDFFDNEHLIKGNVISVGMMGMHFFYVKDDFYAGQFTKRLVPKFKGFNEKLALYFISILNRYSYVLKDMLVRYFDKTVGKIIVSLPLTSSGDINYSYMEERITELEEERITELDSYLKVSGLNDYVLTKEEIEVLEKFKNNEIEFKEFKIGELFEKIEVNKAKKKDVRKQKDNKYCIPTIYCKMGDNGIMYWGKRGDFTICKDVISIIYNGAIATGKVYIQDEAGILAESYFIKLKNPPVSCNISSINLFLSTVIEKLLRLKYTRDNLATWSLKVENDIISLPLTSSGDINYPYMETLINAVKKLSIKGVVDYKDEVINTTKKVVNKTDDSSKLSSEKLVSFLVSEDDKPQEKDEDISTLNNA